MLRIEKNGNQKKGQEKPDSYEVKMRHNIGSSGAATLFSMFYIKL
jgi:hypothetical protein